MMDGNEETYIAGLIEFISETTEENSISNGMVGRIMEYLNSRCHDLSVDMATLKGSESGDGTVTPIAAYDTVELDDMDLMGCRSVNELRNLTRAGKPLIYGVNHNGYRVGAMIMYAPEGCGITQVMISDLYGPDESPLIAHRHGEMTIYRRFCPLTASAASDSGIAIKTWGAWKEFGGSGRTSENQGVWIPQVSASGILSWSLSTSDMEPQPVSIAGPAGKDAYVVEVFSDTGDKLKNGQGECNLSARVLKGGRVIEDADVLDPIYRYIWIKYDKDGKLCNWLGTTSSRKEGNPVRVTAEEIDEKATFRCTVLSQSDEL